MSTAPNGLTCWTCGYWTPRVEMRCPRDGMRLLHLALPDPQDPLVGQEIDGRYYVSHRLGSGGASRVYKAVTIPGGKHVALKTLNAELCAVPGMRARFVEEARLMRELAHPCIPSVEHVGELDYGGLFMVMQLVAGETLFRRAQRTAMSLAEVMRLLATLCRTMVHIHGRGVVHADIKPTNILLCYDVASIKLIDFGVAVRTTGEPMHYGAVLGTPAYASPEQLQGQALDGRSDVYSAASVVYELITGHLPYPESRAESPRKHRAPPPMRDHPGLQDLPRGVDELICAALAPHPDHRPKNAEELLRWCMYVRKHLPPAALASFPAKKVQEAQTQLGERCTRRLRLPRPRRSWRWLTGVGLVALLAALAAATALAGSG